MKKRFEWLKRLYALTRIAGIALSVYFLSGCTSVSPEYQQMQNFVKTAKSAVKNDNYESAAKSYMQAIIAAEDLAPDKVHALKKSLANVYIDWSRSIYWKAKTAKNPDLFKKAVFLCEKAADVHPKYRIRCGIYISKFKKEMTSMKFRNNSSADTLLPDRKEREYKIALLQKQGHTLRREKRYMLAKAKFEEILKIDPFNLNATREIKKIMQTVSQVGKKRQEADQSVKMAEVEWKNVEPIASKEEAMESAERDVEAGTKLQSKLALIKIRKLDFKETPLDQVFNSLQKTISHSLGSDFKFEFKGFKPTDPDCPPITFQAKKIPADDAIKAICDGLKMFPLYFKERAVIEKFPEQ